MAKNLPAVWETWVRSLGGEDNGKGYLVAHMPSLPGFVSLNAMFHFIEGREENQTAGIWDLPFQPTQQGSWRLLLSARVLVTGSACFCVLATSPCSKRSHVIKCHGTSFWPGRLCNIIPFVDSELMFRELPGGPVVRTQHFRGQVLRFGSWSGNCCCHCRVASAVSGSVRPQRQQPTRLCRPWDFPGKNTGVGCHCLLWVRDLRFHKLQATAKNT